MTNIDPRTMTQPARTQAEASALFRRPFAPGAIGFRAMSKVAYRGVPYAGAQVAAYLGAQSVVQRLNEVVPGRWRQQFQPVPAELVPGGTRRIYLACRLIVTLPVEAGGPDVGAVYEDLGEMDSGSFAGLKALYSDARKRAGVAAGIGAYLYTSLEAVVLPIGPNAKQVQAIRRQGKSDLRRDARRERQRPRRGRHRRLRRPRTVGRMMSPQQLTAAPAAAPGTAALVPSAAQLAARIQIPRRLPPRYDGQPLQHLSHSSYSRFVLCPEDWRRRYILGEKTAPTGGDVPRAPS